MLCTSWLSCRQPTETRRPKDVLDGSKLCTVTGKAVGKPPEGVGSYFLHTAAGSFHNMDWNSQQDSAQTCKAATAIGNRQYSASPEAVAAHPAGVRRRRVLLHDVLLHGLRAERLGQLRRKQAEHLRGRVPLVAADVHHHLHAGVRGRPARHGLQHGAWQRAGSIRMRCSHIAMHLVRQLFLEARKSLC